MQQECRVVLCKFVADRFARRAATHPQELHSVAARLRADIGEVERANGLKKGSWKTVFINHRLADLLPGFHSKLHGVPKPPSRLCSSILLAGVLRTSMPPPARL
eukprot:scaffold4656_cov117-Isochrysis_galbana.AAC.21